MNESNIKLFQEIGEIILPQITGSLALHQTQFLGIDLALYLQLLQATYHKVMKLQIEQVVENRAFFLLFSILLVFFWILRKKARQAVININYQLSKHRQ